MNEINFLFLNGRLLNYKVLDLKPALHKFARKFEPLLCKHVEISQGAHTETTVQQLAIVWVHCTPRLVAVLLSLCGLQSKVYTVCRVQCTVYTIQCTIILYSIQSKQCRKGIKGTVLRGLLFERKKNSPVRRNLYKHNRSIIKVASLTCIGGHPVGSFIGCIALRSLFQLSDVIYLIGPAALL